MKNTAKILFFLFFYLLAVKGAADDSVIASKGSSPEITNAYFEPQEPTLKDPAYLIVEYNDPDGDAVNVNLYYIIISPGGRERVVHNGVLTRLKADSFVRGQKDGQVKIFLGEKWHGKPTLFVKLYVIDAAGNKSKIIERKIDILSLGK